MFHSHSKRGIGLVELMLVLAVITTITILSIRYFGIAQRQAKVSNAISMVSDVVEASYIWLRGQPDFTALNMTALTSGGYLPKAWGNGTGINPWGGNLTVGPSSDKSQIVVTMAGIDTTFLLCDSLKNKLSSKATTSQCSGGTYTGTF